MFTEDSVIHPKETAHFMTNDADYKRVVPLNETDFYNQDYIGLKALDEAGKVTYAQIVGDHLQFSDDDIKNKIVPFLNGE